MSVHVSGSAVGPRHLRRSSMIARGGRAWTFVFVSLSILLLTYGCVSPDRPYGEGPPDGGTAGQGGGGMGGGGGQGGDANGEPCSDSLACGSGFCVDGVCCDAACTGTCVSCKAADTGQSNGTCAPVIAGFDPESECADEGASSCGHDGSCDGEGACALYKAGTECAPQSCVDQTKVLAKTCDGAGTCMDTGTVDCAPTACVNNVCATDCTNDDACAAGKYCDGASGECLDKKAIGEACQGNKANQCASGFCADDVCCDAACEGNCEACTAALTGGANGTCAAILEGTDPHGDCLDQGPSSCGNDGTCDGKGACRNYMAGTICAQGGCAGGVQTNPDTCDGMGSCVDKGTASCAPYACAGEVCASMCVIDVQCAAGQYCAAGACVPKKAAAASCGGANECASGFCVDGVCCNTACGGTCQACSTLKKGSGANGVCGAIVVGTDPDSECLDQGAPSCATNGVCNGAGACQLYAAGTVCIASSCTGSTQTNADTCNGMGACADGGTKACAPYACGAGTCKQTCVADADCTSGNACVNGICGTKKPLGTVCAAANECQSNFCVDGVCCDTTCSGLCQACSAAKKGGGSTNGTCGVILVGTDPDNECTDQGVMTCGTNGFCSGMGSCQLYPAGSACVAASCSGSTLTKADTCNGMGACIDAGTQPCSPYTCSGSACKASCAADADCASTSYCVSQACVAKKGTGAACAGTNECASGFCVDGFCCSTACTGLCQACSAAKKGGTNGVCGSITTGTDPDNECTAAAASTCGANGFCAAGACQLYASGTVCVAASCTNGVETKADTCSGTGTCTDAGTKACSPYVCGTTACKTTCAVNADCAAGFTCSGGTCTAAGALPLGSACSTAAQCTTGFCVDGFCCNSACAGTCMSCSGAKHTFGNGICAAILEYTDPDNECADPTICCGGTCMSPLLCPI
ncbi:hypothetical protein [Polyangium sorediatum]|uniref:Tryptophan synthase alpha chain n=1 Tax=Polyangium sorediatum TaxID=889274 RepID=A0ABT6NPX9_9BACT|nr:hypothetical protein [Polyangium sorediatum]MDI1430373.1 hypothetical protein [Polyangium sorediatum]